MKPAVSILVPVFNREDLLVPCLESALVQTTTDLEVVVVDGGSTDGTWDVCLRYAAMDARVRVHRDEVNSGPVRGWWRCLEEARGTLATFLWSDDMLRPEFLTRTMRLLGPEVAFVFTAAEIGTRPGLGSIAYAHEEPRLRTEDFIRGSLRGDGQFPVSPACALFRLDDLRLSFTERLPTDPPTDLTSTGAGTDTLLYLRTALRYPWVACVPEPLAFFRVHPGSLTIDGRNGLIERCYALTGAWFARSMGDRSTAGAITAKLWLREMRTSRQILGPAAAARAYGGIVGPAELVFAGVRVLVSRSLTTLRTWLGWSSRTTA